MDTVTDGVAALTVRNATQSGRDWYIIAHSKKAQLYRFSPGSDDGSGRSL